MNKALAGIKVIEYANGVGVSYCGKLLADLGAQVIKIEKPGVGDRTRRIGPYAGDIEDIENSLVFFYCNTNKQGITLDLDKPEGISILKQLIAGADVFLKQGQPEEYDSKGIGYADLKKINPGLIMVSVTPYGESGPYRNYKANPLNVSHFNGTAFLYPHGSTELDRSPVMLGGHFEEYDVGVMTAIGVLGALTWRRRNGDGRGQYLEISEIESTFYLNGTENIQYAVYKQMPDRRGLRLVYMASYVKKCADGYICPFLVQQAEFNRMADMIGKSEWKDEPWFKNDLERRKRIDEVDIALADWLQDKTMTEIEQLAQEYKVPLAPISTVENVCESEQLNARKFFDWISHPKYGKVKVPGRPFIMSKTPITYEKDAPALGEDNEQILADLGISMEELQVLKEKKVI